MVLTWPLTRYSRTVGCFHRCGKLKKAGFRAHLCGCWRATGLRLQSLIVWTVPLGYPQHRQNSKAKTPKERPRKRSPRARSRISRLIRKYQDHEILTFHNKLHSAAPGLGCMKGEEPFQGAQRPPPRRRREQADAWERGCVGCGWSTCLGGTIQPRRESLDQ